MPCGHAPVAVRLDEERVSWQAPLGGAIHDSLAVLARKGSTSVNRTPSPAPTQPATAASWRLRRWQRGARASLPR